MKTWFCKGTSATAVACLTLVAASTGRQERAHEDYRSPSNEIQYKLFPKD
jgi:hypothetical protein